MRQPDDPGPVPLKVIDGEVGDTVLALQAAFIAILLFGLLIVLCWLDAR